MAGVEASSHTCERTCMIHMCACKRERVAQTKQVNKWQADPDRRHRLNQGGLNKAILFYAAHHVNNTSDLKSFL